MNYDLCSGTCLKKSGIYSVAMFQKREEEAHASSSFYAYRGFESPLRKRAGGTFLGRGVSAGPRFPAAVGRGASQSIPPGPDGSPKARGRGTCFFLFLCLSGIRKPVKKTCRWHVFRAWGFGGPTFSSSRRAGCQPIHPSGPRWVTKQNKSEPCAGRRWVRICCFTCIRRL